MKPYIAFLICMASCTWQMVEPAAAEDVSQGNAIAENHMGVDVFVYSRPTKEYDVIEDGKIIALANCDEVFNKPIKKAADKNGDGVIIYVETQKYDIIKYRE